MSLWEYFQNNVIKNMRLIRVQYSADQHSILIAVSTSDTSSKDIVHQEQKSQVK